jgi:GTP1/Obg family GTP-binding protein
VFPKGDPAEDPRYARVVEYMKAKVSVLKLLKQSMKNLPPIDTDLKLI